MSAVSAWEGPQTPVGTPRRPHLRLVGAPTDRRRGPHVPPQASSSAAGRAATPQRSASTGAAPAPLRLTARGRVVLGGVLLLVALGLVATSVAVADAGAPASATVTVQPGQTLSDVARHELPDVPVAEAVVRLQLANNLSSLQVQAGQALRVPVAR